jgi:hypothetical protein
MQMLNGARQLTNHFGGTLLAVRRHRHNLIKQLAAANQIEHEHDFVVVFKDFMQMNDRSMLGTLQHFDFDVYHKDQQCRTGQPSALAPHQSSLCLSQLLPVHQSLK